MPDGRVGPPYELALHLPLGSASVQSGAPLVIGRSMVQLRDDPCLSRQAAIIVFDSAAPTATITWMAKRAGRLRCTSSSLQSSSRSSSSGSGTFGSSGAERPSKLTTGMQRTLRNGDVISLLADSGRHCALVAIGPLSAGGAPLRPDARGWALLEADAAADARADARDEVAAQTAAVQAFTDEREQREERRRRQQQVVQCGELVIPQQRLVCSLPATRDEHERQKNEATLENPPPVAEEDGLFEEEDSEDEGGEVGGDEGGEVGGEVGDADNRAPKQRLPPPPLQSPPPQPGFYKPTVRDLIPRSATAALNSAAAATSSASSSSSAAAALSSADGVGRSTVFDINTSTAARSTLHHKTYSSSVAAARADAADEAKAAARSLLLPSVPPPATPPTGSAEAAKLARLRLLAHDAERSRVQAEEVLVAAAAATAPSPPPTSGAKRLVAPVVRGVKAGKKLVQRRKKHEQHSLEVTLVACHPDEAANDQVATFGMSLAAGNVVTAVEEYGEAKEAGVLVGDVVRAVNGKPLPPRRRLYDVLKDEFVVAGEELTLGLTRLLDAHMEEATRLTIYGKGQVVRPDSPRMRAREKVAYGARKLDYINNPNARVRRDPYNEQRVSHAQWSNGGAAGRMM